MRNISAIAQYRARFFLGDRAVGKRSSVAIAIVLQYFLYLFCLTIKIKKDRIKDIEREGDRGKNKDRLPSRMPDL